MRHRFARATPSRASRPALLAMALCSAFGAAAQSLPTGGQAIAGQATFITNGSSLLVTTQNKPGANHSAINWQSFSIGAGASAFFQQPNAASTSINRVVTANPSQLLGTLGSNGQLVLVNPSGIAVGRGAVVDTAGFTASTLSMSDADALAGRLRFQGDGNSGALSMQGQVVGRGGDVVLIAPNVEVGAEALVQAQGGAVMLAAGRKVEITGRGLEGIHLEVQAPQDQAVNLGTLKGDAVGIFASTLRHSGVIQAKRADERGGRVTLLGNEVHVGAGATIDASGDRGGGTILVGGDYQGKNPDMPNARNTVVAAGALLSADAKVEGDGGKIIVWADETTRYEGHLSAKGGAKGGSGGIAEVSGKQYLDFRGTADLTAPLGRQGALLLDPANITVGSIADINGDGTTGDDIAGAGDLSKAGQDFPSANSLISASALTSLLNSTSVRLAATNTITINSAIDKTGAPVTTLTLVANTININNTIGSTGGALNLTLNGNATLNSRYRNGTLRVTPASLKLGSGAVFDMIKLGGNLTIAGHSLRLENGLTLFEGITFDTGAVPIYVYDSQTIRTPGSATIVRATSSNSITLTTLNADGQSGTLRLGAGLLWTGGGHFQDNQTNGKLINSGTIEATPTNWIRFSVTDIINSGLIRGAGGNVWITRTGTRVRNASGAMILNDGAGHVDLMNLWSNAGMIRLTAGSMGLTGDFTLSSLASGFSRTGGLLNFAGTLDLLGGTLDIGSGGAFGPGGLSSLQAGTIKNGTLISGDGTKFLSYNGVLRAITIGSDLTMAIGGYKTSIASGLILADGVVFDIRDNTLNVYGSGEQSIATPGVATLFLWGNLESGLTYNPTGMGSTLVLGSGVTLAGHGAIRDMWHQSEGARGSFVNRGTLAPGLTGDINYLRIYGNLDTSQGNLHFKLNGSGTGYYDYIHVDGDITLGSGSVVLINGPGADYAAGDTFDVLRSTTGVIHGPASVVSGFSSTITPAPAPVYLRFTAQSPAPPAAADDGP